MSKRPVKTHAYQPHPDLVDTCVCGRHDPRRVNAVHQLPDRWAEQHEYRRRAGDNEGDEG